MKDMSFDDLKALAESVYDSARDVDRAHAVLAIVEALSKVYCDGKKEVLDAVDARMAGLRL